MVDAAQLELRLGPISVGLRKDVDVARQRLRGKPAYVLHDPVTFKNHAFSKVEYAVVCGIVEQRTLAECFERLVEEDHLEDGDKEEFYSFVLQLHGMNLLMLPMANADRLYARFERKQKARRVGALMSFMYFKIPVFDPDRFLDRTMALMRPIYSAGGLALWATLVSFALWNCAGRFDEMGRELTQLFALGNLPVLYLMIVGLKVLHEFGHAYACKLFGGEVPEMGVILILTAPCAYVDASASWKSGSKWKRIVVALGGMYIETFCAAVFAFAWLATPPGLVHDIAMNGMFLSSAATILFNMNPLMRFDGYFIFADLMEVANLRDRSREFLSGWSRWLFLSVDHRQPVNSSAEGLLFGGYGVASFLYKVSIAFSLTMMILMQWPGVGLFFGVLCAWALIVLPILKAVFYLLFHEDTQPVRVRGVVYAVLLFSGIPYLVAKVPVSRNVIAPGVLESASVETLRAPVDGFVASVTVAPGDRVRPDDVLLTLTNDELPLRQVQLEAELKGARQMFESLRITDAAEAEKHKARMRYLEAAIADLAGRIDQLQVASSLHGIAASPVPNGILGSYVRAGDELVQVQQGSVRVRVILSEADAERSAIDVGTVVQLRWAMAPGYRVNATVREIEPSATRDRVPAQLTVGGGGNVHVTAKPDGSFEATSAYLHLLLEPDWAPEGFVAGCSANVMFEGQFVSLGEWFHREILALYYVWMMA